MSKLISILFLLFTLASCGYQMKANKFVKMLESETGHDYTIVKLHTLIEGHIVVKDKNTGEYIAYNIDKWNKKMSYDQFLTLASSDHDIVHNLSMFQESQWVDNGYWTDVIVGYEWYGDWVDYGYYDEYGYWHEDWYWEEYQVPVYDTVWVENWDHVTYTYYTDGNYTFELNEEQNKDLEKLGAVVQKEEISSISSLITSEYGLSEKRATEVAKLAINWNKLSESKEMTDEDMQAFSKDILGVSLNDFQAEYAKDKSGESSNISSLIEEAAKINEVSPEHIKKLMDDLL